MIRLLNKEFPRVNNKERKVGLYIELKDWSWNKLYSGYNTADVMQRILVENGLGTVEECKDDIPIIVQSFEWEALDYYLTLSDFP